LTGLSRSTISAIVAELKSAHLVVETPPPAGKSRSRGGRPPATLQLRGESGAAIGIDFGHSHVQVAVADLHMNLLAHRFRDLAVDGAASTAIQAAVEMVDEVLAEAQVNRADVIGVGIGVPGPVDRARGLVGSATILPGWVGVRVAHEMQKRLELPVEIDNDANLGALAELTVGAARGAQQVVYVKASTGIGAGLIIGGRLHRGVSGTAGEIGHTTIDENGALCYCGNRGCLETVAAAGAIVNLVRQGRGELSFTRILAMAEAGDPVCRRAVSDAGRQIGVAVAGLCNLLNPEMVVVGGLLSRAGELVLDQVRESVRRCAVAAAADRVQVVPAVLGDRAELIGALALVVRGPNPVFAARYLAPARGGA
jgi:glucokinase-like ROK family protein